MQINWIFISLKLMDGSFSFLKIYGRIEAYTAIGHYGGSNIQFSLIWQGACADECAAHSDSCPCDNVPGIMSFAIDTSPSHIPGNQIRRDTIFPPIPLSYKRCSLKWYCCVIRWKWVCITMIRSLFFYRVFQNICGCNTGCTRWNQCSGPLVIF